MMRKLSCFQTGRVADEPDLLGADIRDVPESSDTQREEWLLTTEPLHGASSSEIGRGDLQWYPSRLGLWTQKPQGV